MYDLHILLIMIMFIMWSFVQEKREKKNGESRILSLHLIFFYHYNISRDDRYGLIEETIMLISYL